VLNYGGKSLRVFMCRSNRADVFPVGFSSAKKKYKMYKKNNSTKTIYFFVEIIHFFKKKKTSCRHKFMSARKKNKN
jgi:hypothetical protein